jgi:hypothetical protein
MNQQTHKAYTVHPCPGSLELTNVDGKITARVLVDDGFLNPLLQGLEKEPALGRAAKRGVAA